MKTNNPLLRSVIQKRAFPKTNLKKLSLSVTIKSVNKDLQLVTGQVYSPNIIDAHGELMEAEDVEYMAHAFMHGNLTKSFDIMHDNRVIDAHAVESWIARGHPTYEEGAWVLTTKINDKNVWKKVRSGLFSGYSIEAMVNKVSAIAEYTVEPQAFGFVEKHLDHDHAYFVFVDDNGRVTGGFTSKNNGHRHIIKYGGRTEEAKKHYHRFALP